MIGIIYDDAHLEHKPPRSHIENPGRVLAIIRSVGDYIAMERPINNIDEWLLRVHDANYVKQIDEACGMGYVFIDADTYVSPGTCKAARHAVGAVLRGIDKVLNGEWNAAYAIVRPPGHHVGHGGRALMAPTQGFCIFNNVAIGAVYAIEHGISRVAILDIDAHHGNGTQEIFYKDPKVLYISLHQDPLTIYPGTGFIDDVGEGEGEGFNVNVPLPPFTADDAYMSALNRIVWPIIREYRPQLILVSLGFDAHMLDNIANLRLSLNTYAHVFKELRDIIGMVRGVVFVLEGGYNYDTLIRGSRLLINIMNNKDTEVDEDVIQTEPRILARVNSVIKDVINVQRNYWNLT